MSSSGKLVSVRRDTAASGSEVDCFAVLRADLLVLARFRSGMVVERGQVHHNDGKLGQTLTRSKRHDVMSHSHAFQRTWLNSHW